MAKRSYLDFGAMIDENHHNFINDENKKSNNQKFPTSQKR